MTTLAEIARAVMREFSIEPSELARSTKGVKRVYQARQIIMFLARDTLQMSYPRIARLLNRKDHTTIIYGCEAVHRRMVVNEEFHERVMRIKRGLV